MQTGKPLNGSERSCQLVEANVHAGLEWVRRRDLPDVLGWKDFADNPVATRDSLCRRASEGRVPGAVCSFPLPKPGKDEMRRLAYLHPLDDLQMRILVDRLLNKVPLRVHPHAFGARLVSGPPGWEIESSNRAWQDLRDSASAMIDSERYATLVKCDIRRCYPSITAEVVERALAWRGFDAKLAHPLVAMLSGLRLVGSPKGLPIGPEASAVIAGLVLGVVDRAMSDAGLSHLRYSDDSFIFVPNGADATHVYDVYCGALDSIGLEPNPDKHEVHSVGDGSAWSALQDPTVSELQHYRAPLGKDRHLIAALDEELSRVEPNWKAVSFCIGGLRYRRSACALSRIYDRPEVFLNLPRQVGRYLTELSEDGRTRHEVDHDWLVEQSTAERGDLGRAAQLHACDAASRLRLGKANGQRLEEMVTASSSCAVQLGPVRAAAARAWGQSTAYRQRRAEDLAQEFGSYDIRRGLIDAIAIRSEGSRRTRSFHQKMWSADPDLQPVLEGLR